MTAIQIQTAVAYVRAARAGMVSDRAPVKTVALAYGVTRRTVERWAVDEGADALAQCVTRSHGSIEGLCAILPALMATSGAQYRKGGDPKAGGGAHVNRSSKRAPILPARARNRRKS
jgi:hypothetical protein